MKVVSIYGLKWREKIFYVGQTDNPARRESQHRYGFRFPFVMVILRKTIQADALRIEKQVIGAFKRKKQCVANGKSNLRIDGDTRKTMMVVSADGYKRFKTACKANGLFIGFVTEEMVSQKTASLKKRRKDLGVDPEAPL